MYQKITGTGQVISVEPYDDLTKVAVETRKVETWSEEVRVTTYIFVVEVRGKDHATIAATVETNNLVGFSGGWSTNGHGSPTLHTNPDGTQEAYFEVAGSVNKLSDDASPDREDSLSIILVGRLGADPDMKYLPDGRPFTNIRFASERTYRDKGSGWLKDTAWFRLTAWGGRAETFVKMEKGQPLLVEVSLTAEEGCPKIWTTQDGRSGASYEGSVASFRFLPWKNGGPQDDGPHGKPPREAAGGGFYSPEDEDEIPF